MDHRRSSLLIGSRTRRNVLKGKNIRKQHDGADNFADYWTDSEPEDSSSTVSDEYTDISQAEKEPQNLRTRLSSNKLHSGTKIKDEQGQAKVLNYPLKSVKKSNSDKNIHDSPTKKQKLSSKLQQDVYHSSTQNLNNVSNSSGQSYVGSEPCLISNSTFTGSKYSTALHKSTEITALPKIKKVKSSQIPSSSILTSNNNNEEECIELNTSQHLVDALRENVSPLLTKSEEEKGEITDSLRSSRSRKLNECLPPQLSASDENDISKCTESTFSPFPKQSGEKKKTYVINENVSDGNFNASAIHMLSPVKVVNTDTNLTNATGSEISPLVNKTSNERNSLTEHKEIGLSSFKSSVGSHSLKKMKNKFEISKGFDVYDEYDTKIIQMSKCHGKRLNVPEEDITLSPSRNVDVSLRNRKNSNVKSSCKQKSSRLSIISPKARILRKKSYENQNKQHLTLNSSKIIPKSTNKKGTETDYTSNNEIGEVEATVSHIDDDACMSHVSEIQDNDVLTANDFKTGCIDKIGDKLRTRKGSRKSLGRFSAENAAEYPEIVQQPTNLSNIQKKIVSKIKKKLKASETFSKDNAEDVLDISEIENEITENLGHRKRKQVNKIHENMNASKTITTTNNKNDTYIAAKGNEITENFDNENEKNVTKTNKKGKVSETFSTENTECAANAPAEGNESMQTLSSTKKKQIPTKKNTAQVIAIKRKKPVSKISDNLKTSRIISKDVENIVPEINNAVTPNFQDEKIRCVNKNKEKQKASETFSKDNDSANEIPEAGNGTTSIDTKRKKHITESCGNLSTVENSDQLVVPSKKKKKKEASTEDKAPVRRSTRQKFPPLAKWRNERLLYRYEKGFIDVIGIDEGTGEDVATIKPYRKKEMKKGIQKKIRVNDVVNKKKGRVSLIKRFEDVDWDKKYEEACPYRIKRMFETESSLIGFMEIKVDSEKPMQYMPNEDVYIIVLKGEIEVNIQNDVTLVKKNTVFIVPRCIPYSLKNVGSTRALIAFSVGKFQYLENNL